MNRLISKSLGMLGVAAVVGIGMVPAARAGTFVNGGFENGNLGSWTQAQGTVSNSGSTRVLTPGSAVKSDLVTPGVDANTLGNLSTVYNGSYAARVNNMDSGAHYSSFTQTIADYTDSKLYFAWAAVLQDPSNRHTEPQDPYFHVTVTDDTTKAILYDVSFDTYYNLPAGGFHNGLTDGVGTWKYTDWNPVFLNVNKGDSFTMMVLAADCTLGGHGGYAYVDAFDPTPLKPNDGVKFNPLSELGTVPEPASLSLLALGSLALLQRRKRK